MHLWTENNHIPRKFFHSHKKASSFSDNILDWILQQIAVYTGRASDDLPRLWIWDNFLYIVVYR